MPARATDFIPRPHHPRLPTLALALALLATPLGAWATDKAAPAPAKTDGNSIGDSIRSLGQQISDPKTPDRIKGHEQEFEKNVKDTREQQRKSHPGEVRASDAADMANNPKVGGGGGALPQTSPKRKPSAGKTAKGPGGGAAAGDSKTPGTAKTPAPRTVTPAK